MILESALLCLALNIFHEARGESIHVQQAVAQVTMNRAKQDQQNVCKEVFRPYQFSWANRLSKTDKANPKRIYDRRIKDPKGFEWKRAVKIAKQALRGDLVDKFNGATHFYNHHVVTPYWSSKLRFIAHAGPFTLMKDTKYT